LNKPVIISLSTETDVMLDNILTLIPEVKIKTKSKKVTIQVKGTIEFDFDENETTIILEKQT